MFKTSTLKSFGVLVTGNTPSSKLLGAFGDYINFVTPSDDFDRKFISETKRSLSSVGAKTLKNKILPAESLLVTCIGSQMGKVTIAKKDVISNQQINSIIPNTDLIDPNYLYYRLKTLRPLFQRLVASSTSIPILNKSDFGKINVRVHASKADQIRTVKVLNFIDAKIDLNNRINTELESLARTIYDYWFLQFDFPDGEGRPYRSSGGEMQFDEELGREVPVGWEVKSLADVADKIQRGLSPKYTEDEGVIVLNQKCIRNGEINYSLARRHNKTLRAISNKLVQVSDILVNSTGVGTLGRVAVVKYKLEDEIIVDSHVTVVRPNEAAVNKHYLGFYMQQSQPYIEQLGVGSTGQTELSRVELGKLNVLLPSENLQMDFQHIYLPMIEKMALNQQENRHLSSLRDWLLPLLMSGEVVVGA